MLLIGIRKSHVTYYEMLYKEKSSVRVNMNRDTEGPVTPVWEPLPATTGLFAAQLAVEDEFRGDLF